jgi:hypothetical protein
MNIARISFVLAAGLVLLGGLALAETWTITTADGKGADAMVSATAGKEKVNEGAGKTMTVMAQPQGGRKAYIRFDLSKIEDVKAIKGATLYLAPVPNTSAGVSIFNVFGLNDGEGEEWVEGNGGEDNEPANELTASNAPAWIKSSGGKYDPDKKTGGGVDSKKATFLGTFGFDNAGYELTKKGQPQPFSSQELADFIAKDTNKSITLIITKAVVDQQAIANFATKEAGKNPPTLKLSTEPMPPTSAPAASTQPAASKPAASKPAGEPASKPAAKKKGTAS